MQTKCEVTTRFIVHLRQRENGIPRREGETSRDRERDQERDRDREREKGKAENRVIPLHWGQFQLEHSPQYVYSSEGATLMRYQQTPVSPSMLLVILKVKLHHSSFKSRGTLCLLSVLLQYSSPSGVTVIPHPYVVRTWRAVSCSVVLVCGVVWCSVV